MLGWVLKFMVQKNNVCFRQELMMLQWKQRLQYLQMRLKLSHGPLHPSKQIRLHHWVLSLCNQTCTSLFYPFPVHCGSISKEELLYSCLRLRLPPSDTEIWHLAICTPCRKSLIRWIDLFHRCQLKFTCTAMFTASPTNHCPWQGRGLVDSSGELVSSCVEASWGCCKGCWTSTPMKTVMSWRDHLEKEPTILREDWLTTKDS